MDREQKAIEAVQGGDVETYAALVRSHQSRIRLVCLGYLGNVDEADDAAQEIFVKAYQALSRFKGESAFSTWLIRIADNHCRDKLRARKSRPAESLDALLAAKGDQMEALLARAQPGNELPGYGREDFELLARLFASLPEDERQILVLREVEEFSYEAIAQSLGCSLDAVKGRLKRARQALTDKCRKFF